MWIRRFSLALALVVLGTFAAYRLPAADEPAKTEPATTDSAKPATPADDAASRYVVPEGDVAALAKFIESVEAYKAKDVADARLHRQKALEAIGAAAEKIISLEKDKESAAYKKAFGLVISIKARNISQLPADQREELLKQVTEFLTSKAEPTLDDARLAMGVAQALERGSQTELAAKAYEQFGALFAKSSEKRIADLGEVMSGCGYRLGLVGKPLDIKGTLVDGNAFDWSAYKGKVVLVDFWASWCGPCRAEIPNVKKNYELYHDRGFDVVGISVDRDRAALDKALEDEQLPWSTVHDHTPGGESGALSKQFGIMAIPTVLLVGRDGKVVSLKASNKELGRLLEELIGPAGETKTDAGEKK